MEAVREAAGHPRAFKRMAITAGGTMVTEVRQASLVSRVLIADSIDLTARGYMFDGLVTLVACDKTIPGAAMGLLRLNIPSLILYGGSLMPGKLGGKLLSLQDVFEAVGANPAGQIPDPALYSL